MENSGGPGTTFGVHDPLNQFLAAGMNGASGDALESNKAQLEFAGTNYPCRLIGDGQLVSVNELEEGIQGTYSIGLHYSRKPNEFSEWEGVEDENSGYSSLQINKESRFLSISAPYSYHTGKTYRLRMMTVGNTFSNDWEYCGIDESCRAQIFVNKNWKPEPVKTNEPAKAVGGSK